VTHPIFEPPIPPADRPLTDAEREELTAIVVEAYGPDIVERMTRAVWRVIHEMVEFWLREHGISAAEDDGHRLTPA